VDKVNDGSAKKENRCLYRSTMLVLPSYTEGIPNVILEAMATRTPIVSDPGWGFGRYFDRQV